MYRLSVYYVCNTLCDMVAHVFYPTFFMIIVYFMAGFKQTVACFFLTLFVVLLIAITSQGAGELFRAAVMSIKRAGMAASLILTTAAQLVKIEDRKDTKHYIELEPLPKSRTETKPITIQSKCFDDDGRVKRTGTFWTAMTHIITAVIGSGFLSLSWAIAQLGWAVGPVVMLLFAVINLYTSSLLTQCYRTYDSVTGSRNYTYPDAVKSILGLINCE